MVHICDIPPQVFPLSILCYLNPYVDTGLSIDSLSPENLPESRVQTIIEAEGEQIAMIEIKGPTGRLESAENCLEVNYNEATQSCSYCFSGQINNILNQLFS